MVMGTMRDTNQHSLCCIDNYIGCMATARAQGRSLMVSQLPKTEIREKAKSGCH